MVGDPCYYPGAFDDMPYPAVKPIAVIADELLQKVDELREENASLRQQVRDLEAALADAQSSTYGDEVSAGESCDSITRLLEGIAAR